MIIYSTRGVYCMDMGCTPITVSMLCMYMSGTGRVNGLHLHKSEGARTIKALKG